MTEKMMLHECDNCGRTLIPFILHVCPPVGEVRMREIIREEIQAAIKPPKPPK